MDVAVCQGGFIYGHWNLDFIEFSCIMKYHPFDGFQPFRNVKLFFVYKPSPNGEQAWRGWWAGPCGREEDLGVSPLVTSDLPLFKYSLFLLFVCICFWFFPPRSRFISLLSSFLVKGTFVQIVQKTWLSENMCSGLVFAFVLTLSLWDWKESWHLSEVTLDKTLVQSFQKASFLCFIILSGIVIA